MSEAADVTGYLEVAASAREMKEAADRYFQPFSGHASLGPYLERIRTISSSACW